MSVGEPRSSWLARLAGVHDVITRVGFFLAGLCLALIVIVYCYEVVSRYLLSAPTTWASSAVSYLLCYLVFLAMPELSRQRVHIFISIVLDTMPVRHATLFQHAAYIVAAIACLLAAWFCFSATAQQYVGNIQTVNEWRIDKWMLSAAIPYGLLSTSLYYMRHVLRGEPYASAEGVQA